MLLLLLLLPFGLGLFAEQRRAPSRLERNAGGQIETPTRQAGGRPVCSVWLRRPGWWPRGAGLAGQPANQKDLRELVRSRRARGIRVARSLRRTDRVRVRSAPKRAVPLPPCCYCYIKLAASLVLLGGGAPCAHFIGTLQLGKDSPNLPPTSLPDELARRPVISLQTNELANLYMAPIGPEVQMYSRNGSLVFLWQLESSESARERRSFASWPAS